VLQCLKQAGIRAAVPLRAGVIVSRSATANALLRKFS
jgi:hypothetical protein